MIVTCLEVALALVAVEVQFVLCVVVLALVQLIVVDGEQRVQACPPLREGKEQTLKERKKKTRGHRLTVGCELSPQIECQRQRQIAGRVKRT